MAVIARLRKLALSIKRDAHALYLAARDPRVPWHVKALAAAIAAYALSPIDLIPDFSSIGKTQRSRKLCDVGRLRQRAAPYRR